MMGVDRQPIRQSETPALRSTRRKPSVKSASRASSLPNADSASNSNTGLCTSRRQNKAVIEVCHRALLRPDHCRITHLSAPGVHGLDGCRGRSRRVANGWMLPGRIRVILVVYKRSDEKHHYANQVVAERRGLTCRSATLHVSACSLSSDHLCQLIKLSWRRQQSAAALTPPATLLVRSPGGAPRRGRCRPEHETMNKWRLLHNSVYEVRGDERGL